MGYLLDTDWIIHALTGKQTILATINRLDPSSIAISYVSMGEVYEGSFSFANPQEHIARFRQFIRPFQLLGLNGPIMERFGEIRSSLHRRGELISDFDILLGAAALQYDLIVLTDNKRHFQRIPDLKLYQPR